MRQSAAPTAEAIERHRHLADELPEGHVRVDMHSHTMWSGDCTTTPEELVGALTASAIDVVCLTDHNATAGAERLRDELPCRVIVGEELRVGKGEIIGLFLTERIAPGMPLLDSARAIRDQGGLVYIPHPFDPMRNCLSPAEIDELVAADLVDAMEAFNAKTSLSSLQKQAADFADANGLAKGAGSDAHVPDAFGAAYVEMPDFEGPTEFLAALAEGRVVGHHSDPARPWTPRIIPSLDDPA